MTLYYIDQGSGLWNDPDNWFQDEAGTIPNYTVPSAIDDCVINAGSTVDELIGTYSSVINFGTVTENFDTITENRGPVITNHGTVELNTFDGIITANNGIVSINGSGGTVTTNASNGTVTVNIATITTNNGTVDYNDIQSGQIGTITTNNGTVTENRATLTTNSSGGNVTTNYYGTITTNNGTVVDNVYGTITTNNSTVTNNYGTVTNNYGTVTTNESEGIVTNNCGTIITNNGFAGPCPTPSYTNPNILKAGIHANYETGLGTWQNYRANVIGLFAANSGTNQSDYRDHLVREFNRKISILNQPTGLFIRPFDNGFRFTGVSIQ
jgi:hypothetical protein